MFCDVVLNTKIKAIQQTRAICIIKIMTFCGYTTHCAHCVDECVVEPIKISTLKSVIMTQFPRLVVIVSLIFRPKNTCCFLVN